MMHSSPLSRPLSAPSPPSPPPPRFARHPQNTPLITLHTAFLADHFRLANPTGFRYQDPSFQSFIPQPHLPSLP